MWWMVASCAVAGMAALEARRVLRDREVEANGPRLYALYVDGQPDQALRRVEIDANSNLQPSYDMDGASGHRVGRHRTASEPAATDGTVRARIAALVTSAGSSRQRRNPHRVRN